MLVVHPCLLNVGVVVERTGWVLGPRECGNGLESDQADDHDTTTKLVTCKKHDRRFCNLRSTNAEHQRAHDLLLPVEVESKELRERQDKQPNVKDDTSSGS